MERVSDTYDSSQLQRMFADLQNQLDRRTDSFRLLVLYAEPDKLYDGLTVYADGTTWNPGSGEGVYTYYNSTWNKLG